MYIGARKAQLELRSVILKNNIPIKNMRDFVQNYAQKKYRISDLYPWSIKFEKNAWSQIEMHLYFTGEDATKYYIFKSSTILLMMTSNLLFFTLANFFAIVSIVGSIGRGGGPPSCSPLGTQVFPTDI